ncbi:phosphocarrier protein [Tistlia consotensis]|uniref:Phosphocarrier protein HPr n=1 Tax=Tistlia consotensis USBA 355 TaxID=560819 RepID=A0A1Y6CGS2_9PROT|nr:HPr family phosphocarrier protein [Tistlia consotensis]SMF55202.1 phosphocarrier protein [Tistlia consotensis USBA 355]SNR87910.1 phosphocarrier protein [Tistlia consotensis]
MTEGAGGAAAATPIAEGSATLGDPTGLHARPAVKLTKQAKGFEAEVQVRAGEAGTWVNAKSPNAVMKLKAGHGERLFFRADGADAEAAVAALVALVERDFAG